MKTFFTQQAPRLAVVFLGIMLMTFIACKKDDDNHNAELISQIEAFTYLTENYPPLNYEEDGKLYGVSVDVLEALFAKMNVQLTRDNISLTPWSEAYQQTLAVENRMLFSTARVPDRELLFKWVGPIAPEKTIVIGPVASNIVITAPADLNNYSVGVIEDYAAFWFYWSRVFSRKPWCSILMWNKCIGRWKMVRWIALFIPKPETRLSSNRWG